MTPPSAPGVTSATRDPAVTQQGVDPDVGPDNEPMDLRVSSPIFIGRSDELERLRMALERAGSGTASKFLVAGEAGVGKTRLVTELAGAAREQGRLVLSGGCIDLGDASVPYAPIVEALRTWARSATEDELAEILGHGRSELARLVPDLGQAPDSAPSAPGGLSLGSAQGRLFELVLGVLQRLSAAGAVILVVEDLHWSDRSTRDLLAFLVRNIRDMGVLLVMTYRSDELHRRHPLLPFLAELERSGHVERLELNRFDRREQGAQLRGIAGPDLDQALVDSIHARSNGNPFFAEELLVSARDRGTTELPPTLREVLLAHVAVLSEPAQEFLRIASAAGQRVDPVLLASATGVEGATLYETLREAVGHQILVPEMVAGEERYAFRHALLQEAVYDDLLPGERTRLHGAFARTLDDARIGGDSSRLSEIAFHWYAAHDVPRAFDSALLAAAAAEGSYAFPEALAQYERALELWDQVPDAESRAGSQRADLLEAAASVARFIEPTRAVAHVRTALGLIDEAADPIRAGLLHERLGRYAWIAGLGALALDAHRTAVRLIPADPPSEARARAVAGLAQILMLQRRYSESMVLAEEAVDLARSTGARQIEGHALNTRSQDRVHEGEVEEALADLTEALRIAEEVGNLDDIGRAYGNRIDVFDVAGRLEEGVAFAREGFEHARRLGLITFFGTHFLCNAANLLYRLGRWEESEAAARQAEEIGSEGINEILIREILARLAMARGQFKEAGEALRAARPLAVQAADGQVIEPVHASLAELALWERRPDEAARVIASGLQSMAQSPDIRHLELFALGIRAHADMAELARARRSAPEAATAVTAGGELVENVRKRYAVVARYPALAPQATAWMTLCDAESRRLEGVPAPDAWRASAEAWEAVGRPYPAAYCRWREGEARLAARGDRKLAAAALTQVVETAERLGAVPLRLEADALALRARLSLGSESPATPDQPPDDATRLGLTAREREVLALVAAGRTNRQIGEELFISEKTAGVHVSNILGKLGVAGRGEAAAVAHQLGLAGAAATTTIGDAGSTLR
jgi:DNA-binding CsgD family transcriptional regulator